MQINGVKPCITFKTKVFGFRLFDFCFVNYLDNLENEMLGAGKPSRFVVDLFNSEKCLYAISEL